MSLMNRMLSKPPVWLAAAIVVGGVAVGSMSLRDGAASPIRNVAPKVEVSAANVGTRQFESLAMMDQQFADLSEQVAPTVVHIKSGRQSSQGGEAVFMTEGQGSGVIFRRDGYIITNAHVVDGFSTVKVVFNDGREVQGQVITANDSANDIAVVKVEQKDLPVATFADSDSVRTGQFAVAVGAPFGIENTVTIGHVSGLGRDNAIPDTRTGQGRLYRGMIQTDAPINPGNSGGPLFNIDGEVIGINSSIAGGGSAMFGQGGNVGVGFAIPSNQAVFFANLLIQRKGKVERAFLGLVPRDLKPFEKKDKGIPGGAMIEEVPSQSAATTAGLKKGDIILRIAKTPIADELDLRNAMYLYKAGETVEVAYLRGGKESTTKVKLQGPPQELAQPRNPNQPPTPESPRNPYRFQMPEGDMFKEFRDRFPDLAPTPSPDPNPQTPAPNPDRPRLGVQVADLTPELRAQNQFKPGLQGAYIQRVTPGSLAERLGLQAGWVITQFMGQTVRSASDLTQAMARVQWGQQVSITLVKETESTTQTQSRTFTFEKPTEKKG